jgi:ABC-type Fe3+ transport system permease subunit
MVVVFDPATIVLGACAVVVLATSVWVFFDAPAHGITRVAALATLLVWIVGFPMYLADRSRVRRRDMRELLDARRPPRP